MTAESNVKPHVQSLIKTCLRSILTVGVLIIQINFVTLRTAGDINEELHQLVSQLMERDSSVESCVLSVKKGDGTFTWTGAEGIANQNGQFPMTEDTPFFVASITKMFTAAAVMRLNESGALSLNDPMAKYLSEELIQGIHVYDGRDYTREIMIKELLSHTSGIADYYYEEAKDGKNLFDIFIENPDRTWTVDETIERTRNDLEPYFPPGKGAVYSDTNFQLLGRIIEAVTHKPLQVVFETFFFKPLGMDHSYLIGHPRDRITHAAPPAHVFYMGDNITKIRSNGSYWADGGIVSTTQDLITFLQALKEGTIISKDILKLMHQRHKSDSHVEFGLGIMHVRVPAWISEETNGMPLWGHSGSTGSFLYYSQDLDLYMAGTINQVTSGYKTWTLMSKAMEIIQSGSEE